MQFPVSCFVCFVFNPVPSEKYSVWSEDQGLAEITNEKPEQTSKQVMVQRGKRTGGSGYAAQVQRPGGPRRERTKGAAPNARPSFL